MSLQDDIFDVEHALEGKPEAEQFDRVYQELADLEREVFAYRKLFSSMREGWDALKTICSADDAGEASPNTTPENPNV